MQRPRRAAPPPPSLIDLEGAGLVRGTRWWARASVLLGALAAVVVALLVPVPRGPFITVVGVGTAAVLVLSLPRLQRLWDAAVGTIAVVALLGVVWYSGGATSPLRHLLLLPILYVAAAHARGQVLWLVALVAAGRTGLLLVDGAPPTLVAELVVELVVAVIIAAAAYAMRASLGRASEQLERTDQLHRVLVQEQTNAVYVLDLDGGWRELNDTTEEVTGYRAEDLVGRSSLEVVAPEARDSARYHFELAANGSPQTYETVIVRADGRRLPLLITNVRVELGRDVVVVHGIASDLTDALRERRAREASERRFERLTETTNDGIYVVRTDGDDREFLYVNPAMTELTGVPAQEWYRDPHVGRRYVSADQVQHVLAEQPRGEPYRRPVLLRWSHPQGDRWLEFHEVPWEDDAGEVVGVQGIVHDVTELVRQQEAADAALEKEQAAVEHLRKVDEMKNAFLQSVSHELRTPLTSVVGLADTVASHLDALPPDKVRLLLSRTVANARKLERLLSDLLDVDRLSRGVLAPRIAAVDLAELAARVLSESEEAGGRVVADLQPTVVPADGPKVERIIENLLHNAVRHTADGTPVWLRVAAVDGGAEIVVEDAGDGIEDELAGVLFEPFSQGVASADAANPGTGIGLSLVARFTELHGGQVAVEERPGGGARFRVWLPAGRP